MLTLKRVKGLWCSFRAKINSAKAHFHAIILSFTLESTEQFVTDEVSRLTQMTSWCLLYNNCCHSLSIQLVSAYPKSSAGQSIWTQPNKILIYIRYEQLIYNAAYLFTSICHLKWQFYLANITWMTHTIANINFAWKKIFLSSECIHICYG